MSHPPGMADSSTPMPPPGSPMRQKPPRESNISSEARPSYSQTRKHTYKLETVYSPATNSEFGTNVDIVAVHGLSEDADSTWVFTPPARAKGPTSPMGGKTGSSFIPGISTIAEGGVAVGNIVKNTAGKAYDQLSNPTQHITGSGPTAPLPTGNSSQQDVNKAKAPKVQSSNVSLTSDILAPEPAPPARKVNWLKDENMLQRSFPRARIMQFRYPSSLADSPHSDLQLIASELLQRLSDERKECGSGLTRPIIFIGHSFGGIVISEALIKAAKEEIYSNICTATVGLLFLGTPFKGSMAVVAQLKTKMPKRTASKIWRPHLAPKTGGPPASPQARTQAQLTAGTSTPPHNSSEMRYLYTLLDTSINNEAILSEIRIELKNTARKQNFSIACFYEKFRTEAGKQLPKDQLLVEKDSAVLEGSLGVELLSTHTSLSKFQSPEDSNFMQVKKIIKDDIDFTITRRLWDAISKRDLPAFRKQLTKGAKFNQGNSQGKNALHQATEAGDLEMVKLLLEKGVEVNAKDVDQHSPIRCALLEAKYDILDALLKRGAIADKEDEQNVADERCRNLLSRVTFFQGPRIHSKKQESLPSFDEDRLPEECRIATGRFQGTITTFHLRSEKDTEDKFQNDAAPSTVSGSGADEYEREYHVRENLPLSEILFVERDQDLKDSARSGKEWKWYHLPANNMDWVEALFTRLGVDNTDGRLSGQEHRGRFPHALFLQPEARVFRGNGHQERALFMPYLHFETNEGRINLSNAIKRTASSLAHPEKDDDDARSLTAETELTASPKALFTYDDDSFDSDSEGDQTKGKTGQKVISLKAKFKSFERAIRRCRNKLWERSGKNPSEDDDLVGAYMALDGHRLHIRRTLDQFYYIGMEDTEGRDTNQVVQRYAIKGLKKISTDQDSVLLQGKLIMVDQLWLWVLGNNTVITSFPQGWGQSSGTKDDRGGVLEQIELYLRKPVRDPITSVDALAAVIVTECTRIFGRFQVPTPELQFIDFFDSSISDADRHSRIFAKLDVALSDKKDFVKTAQKSQKNKTKKEKKKDKKIAKKKAEKKKELKESQLDIDEEVELLVEIQDIQDELNIIKMVLDDQISVLSNAEPDKKETPSEESHASFPYIDGKAVDNHVKVNRKTIEHMIGRAKDVYDAVYHLIDLKQKQANVAEARYAREEAQDTAKEGKTILALTVVNMIFLPLSFMSSFFTLNIVEFPKDPVTGSTVLHLRWVAQYVFGISFAIAIPSIAIAMAIGPMASFTQKLGRTLRYWGLEALSVVLGVFLIILIIALIPVAVGLVIAGAGIAAAGFILYALALIVFYMFRGIWECTPYYRRREARKKRERSDLEDAAQNDEPETQVNRGSINGGGDEQNEVLDEKGTMVMDITATKESIAGHYDSGKDPEIEELAQPTMI